MTTPSHAKMTSAMHDNLQDNYEADLARALEDETLRLFDDLYHDNLDSPGAFELHVRTLYLMLLRSTTAFDALLLDTWSDDAQGYICEIARDWLLDFGAGDHSGAIFEAELISRIDRSDYQIKED